MFKGILIKWLIARYYPLNTACVPIQVLLCLWAWLVNDYVLGFVCGGLNGFVSCLPACLRAAPRTFFFFFWHFLIWRIKTGGCFHFPLCFDSVFSLYLNASTFWGDRLSERADLGMSALISVPVLMGFYVVLKKTLVRSLMAGHLMSPLNYDTDPLRYILNIVAFIFSYKQRSLPLSSSDVQCAVDPVVSHSFSFYFDDIWSHVTVKTLLQGFIFLWLSSLIIALQHWR